jgi:uncharacterized membrane-anchored protein YitT (DUF2179 family)/predicted metal-dependent HD superfamily phosphohydrolase
MQYQEVYNFLMNKLEKDLPSYLIYHKAQHTKNVIAAAVHLAHSENVSENDLVLLKTAALFHDAGFLQQTDNHEEISCEIAKQHLPLYDYTPEQIDVICRIIRATKIPQTADDDLGKILCDADLSYLGTDEYTANANDLFEEFKITHSLTDAEWQGRQITFLSTHKYFTQTAIDEREHQKQINLQKLKSAAHSSTTKRNHFAELLQDVLLMVFGVIIAGFALKCFMVPNRFFDGGVTGISLLVHELYHINLTAVILVINLPLIIVSYFSVGKRFAIRTFISIILLGICLYYIPEYAMTKDKLLISIFGGVFLGIGIGLIMRAGAALDGIEVLALYTLKRTSFTITEIILGINILIFAIAAFKFGIETSLYSILTYFAATSTINYVVEGLQAYTGVTIISGESEEIKHQLVNNLGRGITVYKGERGFLPGKFEVSSDCDIIFTVVTRLEMRKLKNLVYNVDANAFVFASTIKEASGGIIKRKQRH